MNPVLAAALAGALAVIVCYTIATIFKPRRRRDARGGYIDFSRRRL